MMTREDFKGAAISMLSEMYDAKIVQVNQPNYSYEAIRISQRGQGQAERVKAGTMLPVDDAYDYYLKHDLTTTINLMVETYEDARLIELAFSKMGHMTKEQVCAAVRERLIPLEGNGEYLQDKIYYVKLDMAVVFEIQPPEMQASFVITREIAKTYGLNDADIIQAAKNNRKVEEYMFRPLKDVVMEIYRESIVPECIDDIEKMLDADMRYGSEQYVLTNQKKYHGAAVMLDLSFLAKLAQELQGDLIILPSSQHEVLVMKDLPGMSYQEGAEMVAAINQEEVLPADRLPASVYMYKKESNELLLVATVKKQILQQEQNLGANIKI